MQATAQPVTVLADGIPIPLSKHYSANTFSSFSARTMSHFVVTRTIEFICADNVFADLRILAYLPAYSNYTLDVDRYKNMPEDGQRRLIMDMRRSGKALLKSLQIIINPDVKDSVAFVDENHDQPTITFTGVIFDALARPTTQAEFEHIVLFLITTTMREFGHLWFREVGFLRRFHYA